MHFTRKPVWSPAAEGNRPCVLECCQPIRNREARHRGQASQVSLRNFNPFPLAVVVTPKYKLGNQGSRHT